MPGLLDTIRSGVRALVGSRPPQTPTTKPASSSSEAQNDAARFEQAQLLQRQGKLKEAEALYRALLAKYPHDFDLLYLLGTVLGRRGEFPTAIAFLEQALARDPDNALAHGALGNCYKGLQENERALASYDKALALRPDDADTLNNRGATLRELGRPNEALASLDEAVAIAPQHALAHHNRALALVDLSQHEKAVASFEQVIHLQPDNADAYADLAATLRTLGRLNQALQVYGRALAYRPNEYVLHLNKGITYFDSNSFSDALRCFDRVLELNPTLAQAYCLRGDALSALNRDEEALASYGRAIEFEPNFVAAMLNQAATFTRLNRHHEALQSCDRALAADPDFVEAISRRATVLANLGRHQEALTAYDNAIAIKYEHAYAHNGCAAALWEIGRFDDALSSYERAIQIEPNYAEAHFSLSLCYLQLGHFERGWKEYEWRWQTPHFQKMQLDTNLPLWKGGKINGSLLVWNEQGVGDEIFHASMLNELLSYAQSVTACVDPRLVPLFQRSFTGIRIISRKALGNDARFEAQVPLGSLGRYFRPDFGSIASASKPFLRADPERSRHLQSQFANGQPLKCGISWNSKNRICGDNKSLGLRDLEPVLRLVGIDYVNLQYGDTAAEQADLQAMTGLRLSNVTEIDNYNDIDGLASLIETCDVVVTVSNTTAHLAAALGRPVLVMLPFGRGSLWQWHTERADSPWYPSVRLFRQQAPGDWSTVIRRVRDVLMSWPPAKDL